jgi:hypothetical protein
MHFIVDQYFPMLDQQTMERIYRLKRIRFRRVGWL